MSFPTVYLYNYSDDSRNINDLESLLGNDRFGYCKKMKSEKAGLCSAYAFLLLRYALKKEYGLSDIPSFRYNDYGKPFLKEHPGIYFNMSHADKCAVCALSDRPVGVDIQDVRNLSIRVARKFLTDSELEAVSAINDPEMLNDELCRLWCIKESIGKCRGKGFGEGFTGIDADKLVKAGTICFTKRNGFYISVCIMEQE